MDILSPIIVINLPWTCKKLYKKNISVQRLAISFATDKKLTTSYNRIYVNQLTVQLLFMIYNFTIEDNLMLHKMWFKCSFLLVWTYFITSFNKHTQQNKQFQWPAKSDKIIQFFAPNSGKKDGQRIGKRRNSLKPFQDLQNK